jgi:hypothetical protein
VDAARSLRISSTRWRGASARWIGSCVVLGWLCAAPGLARAGCVARAPGADGVLRLDAGRAVAWPCAGPLRAYAAAPSGTGAMPPAARPTPPQPRPRAEAPATVEPGSSPAAADVARLKEQAARLADELVRLNEETAGLRAETKRLRDQLTRREVGDEPSDRRGGNKLGSRIGPPAAGSSAPSGADARVPELPAPKGDLLKAGPSKDETRAAATAAGAAAEVKPAEPQLEFERRKSVAERAWSELLDFAARMKKDLSGKPE